MSSRPGLGGIDIQDNKSTSRTAVYEPTLGATSTAACFLSSKFSNALKYRQETTTTPPRFLTMQIRYVTRYSYSCKSCLVCENLVVIDIVFSPAIYRLFTLKFKQLFRSISHSVFYYDNI